MCRIRTGVLSLVLLGLTACSPAPPDTIPDFLARTLPDGVSGTVVVARGDRLVHCAGRGMADHEARTAATCDTVYDVMSITKQFTAAAVLKLETMGKLAVTDPIGVHLGPVPADKQAITVHHLLTHTAGLVEGLGDDYDELSRAELVAKALGSTLLSPPSTEFHYSNTGYSLLTVIVEEASGLGYEEFLATHLFAPAGMTSTGYVLPRWDRDQVAVEYDARGESQGRPFDHPWAQDGPHWNLRGNGGMLSTARDMFRWHRALSGDTVLPAAARDRLFAQHTPVPDSDGEFYGYGWSVADTEQGRVAWHDGGNGWSLATFARTPHAMVFWVGNNAYRDGEWNLEDQASELTLGLLARASD